MKEDNFLSKAISKNISRRSFVKWTAAVGATASMSGLVVQSAAKMAGASSAITSDAVTSDELQDSKITQWVPTHCLTCHGWCDLAVGIDKFDVVRKVEGLGGQPQPSGNKLTGMAGDGTQANTQDDTHERYCRSDAGYTPYSIHNRGRICAKGNDCMEHLYDPDRVKYCLERVGERGSGRWKKISWREAYIKIGSVLQDFGRDTSALANGGSVLAADGASDRRHRLVFWVGRNEDHGGTDRFFDKNYGITNHIEHTSICESSRHTAQIRTMNDKFPLPWVTTTNNSAGAITDSRLGIGTNMWTMNWKDSCDLFVSIGGNVLESSIPHASYSQRVADIRRNGGRVMGIDIRQSNTLAWADEYKYVEPGTDAALVGGVIHTILKYYDDPMGLRGGVTALRARLNSRPNNRYVGIFEAEAGTAAASPVFMTADLSLESYLFNGANSTTAYGDPLPDGRSGTELDAAEAELICNPNGYTDGITAADIHYLAWAFSGNFGANAGDSGTGLTGIPTVGTEPPRNPIMDGYRGICKHTNGAYTVKMVRALQILACGFDDGDSGGVDANNGTLTEFKKRSGGVNRPGGLVHDAHSSLSGGAANGDGGGAGNHGIGGNGGSGPEGGTVSSGLAVAAGTSQRIDNWDYLSGGSKFALATHKNDQMVIPGIRASIGLDPFLEGQLNAGTAAVTNPYYSSGFDTTFEVEALLSHKNNPGYSRPNIELDRDTFTATDPSTGQYRLKNYWTIDMNMGDGSLYADIILAEAGFLERYANKWWENHSMKTHIQMRQPVRQVWGAITGVSSSVSVYANGYNAATLTASGDQGVNLPLYESRTIWRICYELARAVEADYTITSGIATNCPDMDADGVVTALGNTGAGYSPWNAACFNGHNWSGSDSYKAERDWFLTGTSGVGSNIPGTIGTGDQFDYMRTNGVYATDGVPSFFKDSYIGSDKPTTDHMEVYTKLWDTAGTDNTTGTSLPNGRDVGVKSDGSFYGCPVYVKIPQNTDTSGLPYQLTTYRINVHTHARTASCPRLQEILGSSWAVMHPDTAAGIRNKADAVVGVVSGDTVELSTEHWDVDKNALKTRSMQIEVKVTPRAKPGWIGVSHSQGHAITSFGGDTTGDGNDGFKVDPTGSGVYTTNRYDQRSGDNTNLPSGNNVSTQATQEQILSPSWGAAMDNYRWTLKPSAPSTDGNKLSTTGHGSHPNWIINRTSDPIGASAGFFDGLCDCRKI